MDSRVVTVGRADILDKVVSALSETPQMVLIGGEPGIGKTHLLGEVIARLPEFRVLRGQARELDGGLAYAPLAGAFATLDEEAPAELAELYGAIDEAALGHSPVAPAVLAAQLLASLPGRTLLAIDDLHLADADTLSVLRWLPRRVPRVAILGTARRPPALDVDLAIRLEPLSMPEVAGLVTALLGRTPSETIVRRVHMISRGNPWFAQEAVLSLVQGGAVWSPDPGARRGAILRRLFQRDQGGRTVAKVLAALSRTRESTDLEPLAELAGLGTREAEHAFDGLVRDGVVTRTAEGYGLAHPLVAEALYDDLGVTERRRVHTRIAEWLQREGLTGTRRVLEWAAHVAEGGSPDEALTAMMRAAELTRWTAPLSAAHWYGRAAEIADDKGDLLARQAMSYWKGSRPALALNSGQRALAVLPPGRRHTRTACIAVAAAHSMGWYEVALAVSGQQLPHADDPTALLAQQAMIKAELGHPDADLVRRVEEGLVDCPPEDRVIAAGSLAIRAVIQGDWAASRKSVDDLLGYSAALPPGARLAALESAAHVMSVAGLRSRTIDLLDQAEQIHRGLGWHDIAGQYVRTMAVVRRLGGEWDQALDDIAAGMGAMAEAGLLENLALLRNIQLDILLDQGKTDEVERVLADPPPECPMQTGLRNTSSARLALLRGDRATARRELEHAIGCGIPDVLHRALAVQVLLHVSSGDEAAARTAAAQLSEHAAAGTPRAQLAADLAMGRAFGDRSRTEAALDKARADGLPFEEAQARFVLGVLGDHIQLPRAHSIFVRLGATPWQQAAERRMREAGLAPTADSGLTPSERRVIALVADGLSNPQIAEELHYSRKTVEVYLTRVYAKTGLRSRVELALAVARGEL
ncbi:LuxR family transcriptional regulator [Planotetraspora silvatica]|uniref:LuxR family transcriptional regulator n=1 Tax=Planotetraspora silvatica TaxID=234614 RepID=A0A8J3UQ56_9ACTN|nr:LuxR family transcriptional regulator [Planotetraspora silvatica]GII48715.1 LuxR family transcriptional regulator [Planotetraspora silvatica]